VTSFYAQFNDLTVPNVWAASSATDMVHCSYRFASLRADTYFPTYAQYCMAS